MCVQGKLALEQVKIHDEAMHEAATQGLYWRVISTEAMEVLGLADLIQAGANTSAQLARGESEFQMVRRILNTINANGGSGNSLLFQNVKASIMKTRPACADAIPEIFTFLVRHGAAPHLQDRILRTEERIKRSKVEPRSLGMQFFRNLSMDAKDTKQDACVHFRHAMLSLAYCSEESGVVTSHDAKKVSSKDVKVFDKVLEGQQIIKKMQKAFTTKVPRDKLVDHDVKVGCLMALDAFEDMVVMLSLDKKVGIQKVEEAASIFVDKIKEITGTEISAEYDSYRKTAAPSQAVQSDQGVLIL